MCIYKGFKVALFYIFLVLFAVGVGFCAAPAQERTKYVSMSSVIPGGTDLVELRVEALADPVTGQFDHNGQRRYQVGIYFVEDSQEPVILPNPQIISAIGYDKAAEKFCEGLVDATLRELSYTLRSNIVSNN